MSIDEPYFLVVYVQPGASSTEFSGMHGDNIKVRLQAQPQENQANEALINFLANSLEIPKSKIEIVSGTRGRTKKVKFHKSSPKLHQLLLSKR
ncbi:MAG: DUF167 domain-containing protein [Betaproteobacteria bacterium]|nr:DUF167 domain-containing protein [Betaproteobacteria bacterium]MDE2423558.1 DUF167 domain-containing protein [Betaproteobacteria bacterium]